MNDLAAFGIIMGFSLLFGAMLASVLGMLGLIDIPKSPKEFVISLIEYWLYQ